MIQRRSICVDQSCGHLLAGDGGSYMDTFRVVPSADKRDTGFVIEWIQPNHPPVVIMRRFSTALEAQIWADRLAALDTGNA